MEVIIQTYRAFRISELKNKILSYKTYEYRKSIITFFRFLFKNMTTKNENTTAQHMVYTGKLVYN